MLSFPDVTQRRLVPAFNFKFSVIVPERKTMSRLWWEDKERHTVPVPEVKGVGGPRRQDDVGTGARVS